jgi:hypothetical protein
MLTIATGIVTLVATCLGIYWKYFRKPPSALKEEESINHAMLQDAADRPSKSDIVDSMRNGKF